MLRQLLVTFVGHVDHGKTSIQDYIRGSSVALSEPGLITQSISCTKVPFSVIEKLCKGLIDTKKIKIPGFLFLDTPGHASFTSLRKRGGSLADIAVLVVDINEGLKPQTIEAIEILKSFKTPFVIAANKIDLIKGWHSARLSLIKTIESQAQDVKNQFDNKFYTLVGQIYEKGFNAERFDKVEDYTKQVAIVPISAKTGDGIPELLTVLTGLAQRFLESNLEFNAKSPGRGVILEVKDDKNVGTYLDVVIYDGHIQVNDQIILGTLDEPIITKVRSLFDSKKSIKSVEAACSVRVIAPNAQDAIAGAPLVVANKDIDRLRKEVMQEVKEVVIDTGKEGVIIKADSLGSLEALISLLKEKKIMIRRASIGNVLKKDIAEACSQKNQLNRIILGFNIKNSRAEIPVIAHNVIYKIIDDYEKFRVKKSQELESYLLNSLTRPCKFVIMPHYVFRQSNPAVVGVDLLVGLLKTNTELMKKDGKPIGKVKSIQIEGENATQVEAKNQVAISLPDVTMGRQAFEGDVIYSNMDEDDFKKLKTLKKHLNDSEILVLKEIAEIKRKTNPLWGV